MFLEISNINCLPFQPNNGASTKSEQVELSFDKIYDDNLDRKLIHIK